MNTKILIWGLRKRRHSHRYIHQGLYENLKYLGYEVNWVEDEKANQVLLQGNNIVFAVDIASSHLLNYSRNFYITHNIEDSRFSDSDNRLRLQVHTNNSSGVLVDDSISLFDSSSKTLFQPWGVPEPEYSWLTPISSKGKVEYWIGSVWNNALNQGNKELIELYTTVLKEHLIRFRKVGGTRWYTKEGLSSKNAFLLVNKSPIGTAVVGEWQKTNSYIPCRLFKNVCAGSIPSSNADFSMIFADTGVFHEDLEVLINQILAMPFKEKKDRIASAQELIKPYTYSSNIKRIFSLIGE